MIVFLLALLLLGFSVPVDAATAKCGGNEICIFAGLKASSGLSSSVSRSDFLCPAVGTMQSGVQIGIRDGILLSVSVGTPVKASASGVVVESAYDAGKLGKYVKIQHSEKPEVFTVYGYLSEPSVREKDRVKKGDVIGKSGSSVPEGQAQLYFSFWRDGRATRDPESICPAAVLVDASKVLPAKPASRPGTVDCSRFQSNGMREPWKVIPEGRNGAYRTYNGRPGSHTGFDFGDGKCGSPVLAVWDGEVVYAKNTGEGYGNQVAVKTFCTDGTQRMARYSHMASYSVASGQTVKAGQVIGAVGNTGGPYPCHLHLDIFSPPFSYPSGRVWGTLHNPEPLIVGGVQAHLA